MSNRGIFRPVPREFPTARLFCFPFAGGAATAYRLWPTGLPASLEVVALQLPGRGSRLRETPLRTIEDMVAVALAEFKPWMDRPFAVFGHSMGAILAREFVRASPVAPQHLFVSSRPPRPTQDTTLLQGLSDADFLTELDRRYQGVPAELWKHPDVLELLLPSLRADIEALETFQPDPAAPRLSCPITVYGGSHDPNVRREDLEAWRTESTGQFRARVFSGDHFYLDPQRPALLADIAATLAHLLASESLGGCASNPGAAS